MTSAGAQQERLPLTRERILAMAVELVDEHGVDALTMRRLGAALGVEAMSIYNHVPNKAALLDGVVEVVVGEIDLPSPEAEWDDKLRHLGRSYREMTLRHPHVVPLLAMRPFSATPALKPVEVIFEALATAGFDRAATVNAYRLMAAFALGFSMTEAAGLVGGGKDVGEGVAGQSEDDLSAYPNIAAALPHLLEDDGGAQFEYGLTVLIEGLRSTLRR